MVCPGRHTLTNILCTCGRAFEDWSADYRLFSADRWEPGPLFRPVVRGVLEMAQEPSVFVTAAKPVTPPPPLVVCCPRSRIGSVL